MRRFVITTLGCKVNQYDAQSVADMLRRAGWRPVTSGQQADLVLVQTCCITTVAMRKSRQAIRRSIRRHTADRPPMVCVLGCYGTYHESEMHDLLARAGVEPGRRIVAPSDTDPAEAIRQIIQTVETRSDHLHKDLTPLAREGQAPEVENSRRLKQRRLQAIKSRRPGTRGLGAIEQFTGHQRAFVKIQDGCDAFCSYCVVPYTRPHVWSRDPEEVLDECRQLVRAGHREIVLCGVFLGAYGRATAIRRNWPTADCSPLTELVRCIADIDGLWRVRLSSLEPADLTEDLLEVVRHGRVAPHLHLPLQSGSGKTLRRMNRQYTPRQFIDIATRLHETLDRPALTTDIIVGFPGESETDFQATLDVAREARFSKIHAFPFSAIEPTPAWQQRHEAPPPELARDRMDQLAKLEADLAERYRQQFVGETVEGLVENTDAGDGRAVAMTDRYLSVSFPGTPADLAGELVDLKITGISETGLTGEPL